MPGALTNLGPGSLPHTGELWVSVPKHSASREGGLEVRTSLQMRGWLPFQSQALIVCPEAPDEAFGMWGRFQPHGNVNSKFWYQTFFQLSNFQRSTHKKETDITNETRRWVLVLPKAGYVG